MFSVLVNADAKKEEELILITLISYREKKRQVKNKKTQCLVIHKNSK